MLRLAALVDGPQYVRVSGAREERMIAVCRSILEPLGWVVRPRRGRCRDGSADMMALDGRPVEACCSETVSSGRAVIRRGGLEV